MNAAIAAGKLPGAVVAVGDGKGVRYLRAFGQRALTPQREAMTVDTVFDLASLTKPLVTATAIGWLADRGKLSLDDTVRRHLPAFAKRGKGTVTIRQLLTHTGGLPAVTPRRDFEQARDAALLKLQAVAPEAPAGARFDYSDSGYIVLGALVEVVSGQRLDAFAEAHIFRPLKLRDTGFGVTAEALPRTAPTEERDGVPIRGQVHDPRAYRLGGVAGNAGLFSTAADLSVLARMWLGEGAVDGTRVLSAEQVRAMTQGVHSGHSVRTAGWDRQSAYSGLRGQLLSPAAFGHGGFTGTSLWLDPDSDLFVILLSNRVHPDGKGRVIELAGEVADAAARGRVPRMPALVCDQPPGQTRAGIDVLVESDFAALQGARVGLVVNDASRARDGQRTADLLHAAAGVELLALFSPEHGIDGREEGRVTGGRDRATGLPVHSLFGKTRRPNARMLRGIDTLVFDLQDMGVRFFTYMSTLTELMEAGAAHDVRVVVLDRPNPLGGERIEGPLLDEGIHAFVNFHRLPVRHGMTAGELAGLLRAARAIDVRLEVVWMRGYRRQFLFSDTGLPWRAPSPNLPTLRATLAYPAIALLESTNLSVGRGTYAPFELLGAPFADGDALAARLAAPPLPGVHVEATHFVPATARHRGRSCRGLRVRVDAPRDLRAVDVGLRIGRAFAQQHPDTWDGPAMQRMLGHADTLRGLLAPGHEGAWSTPTTPDAAMAAFENARRAALHYPDCRPGAP